MAIVAGGGGALLLGGALLAWRFTVIRGRRKGALDGVAYYPKVERTVGEVSASDAEAPMGGAELGAPEPCPEQAEVMSDPESPEATIAI